MRKYLFLCLVAIFLGLIVYQMFDFDIIRQREYILVNVKGEVEDPRQIELPANSYLIDLLDMVTLKETADILYMQQNIPLKHLDIITIPKIEIIQRISINNASLNDLKKLPGIGEALANRIINYRLESGLFQKLTDIMKVKGIKQKLFDKIKDFICL